MIIKLNYIKHTKEAKQKARNYVLYIDRHNRLKLFNNYGLLEEELAEQEIKRAAKNIYFWRLIISPDKRDEDLAHNLDMEQLTKEGVLWLEERIKREIPFIAALHTDTDNRHTQSLLFIARHGRADKPITKEVIRELRAYLHQVAGLQQEATRGLQVTPTLNLTPTLASSGGGGGTLAAPPSQCAACGESSVQDGRCNACGAYQGRGYSLSL